MDWCGYYVIPAAIDMRVYVEVSPQMRKTVEVRSFKPFQTYSSFSLEDIRIDSTSDLRYVGGVLKAMVQEGSISADKAFKIKFARAKDVAKDSNLVNPKILYDDLPVQKGLSSSAALCIAVAAAADLANRFSSFSSPRSPSKSLAASVMAVIDENLTRYANLAYVGERKILGINCGQMDQYASAHGSLLFIDCQNEPARIEKLSVKSDIPLVIGDTQQPKNTPKVLAWLGNRFKKRETLFVEGAKGIVEVVEEARKEFQKSNPNLNRVGELMNLNQLYLSRNLQVSGDCPISPSNMDKLINAALEAGALGAKISGSGGGGCMVALCENEEQRKEVARAIEGVGGKAYSTKIAEKGLRLEALES